MHGFRTAIGVLVGVGSQILPRGDDDYDPKKMDEALDRIAAVNEDAEEFFESLPQIGQTELGTFGPVLD